MRLTSLLKIAVAMVAAAVLGHAGAALAVDVSSSPDTDTFRTGGCTGCFITQVQAITASFSDISRVWRGCYTNTSGTKIVPDGSNCDGAGSGRLADFFVIQGTLKSCVDTTPADGVCDTGSLGVINGATLGTVTYRVSGNGSGNGIACSRTTPATAPMGFLAPEGFDGTPGTADDAGGNGVGNFGVAGPGIGAGTATMVAAPLINNCNTKLESATYETLPTGNSFLGAPNTHQCIVNYDLNGDGTIQNDQVGAAVPGGLINLQTKSDLTTLTGNESTNLKLSCDTGFADLPPGDFLPPRDPFNQQDVFGAQIFKIAVSRDLHAASGVDDKLHLNDPQIENIFGNPENNSVCRVQTVGGLSTSGISNVTACIRPAGSGSRETFRNTFMADTEGSKIQTENDPAGTTCLQTKEAGGTQISTKKVISGPGNDDVVNCLAGNKSAFAYIDADRFDPALYSAVVEGVDTDAAILAASPQNLKDLVKCGHYRFWGPLSGGVGQHNPGGSIFITAQRAALKNPAVYLGANAYLPLGGVGFTKTATDGSYSLAFLPTTCPAAPANPITISASPTASP